MSIKTAFKTAFLTITALALAACVTADPKQMLADAQSGNPDAQYELGLEYLFSGGALKQDSGKAIHWLNQASDQDHGLAAGMLGLIYKDPTDFKITAKPDYAKAVTYLTKASYLGEHLIQTILAGMYGKGEGVEKDEVMALAWASIAAEQGDKNAALIVRAAQIDMSPADLEKANLLIADIKKKIAAKKVK